MVPFALLLLLLAVWLGYLALESLFMERHRRAVPLRIAVTGTRGKTSVTRLVAAVLRESGRAVLAKSTGAEAEYVLPDGTVHEIRRLGPPSIIEQKWVLAKAAKAGAEALVAEIMSVHPDNHRVEAHRILRPRLVLVTNFRVDHVEAQGTTREEVASVLALAVPAGATALVPEEEWEEGFEQQVRRRGGAVVKVPAGTGMPPQGCEHFAPNLDLVWSVARSLQVPEDVIRKGVQRARGDLGALKAWRFPREDGRAPWLVVNAFAANDPESTLRIYDRVLAAEGSEPDACVGFLALRPDRGDRTLQWAGALEAGALRRFRHLYVCGLHAPALVHRLRNVPEARRASVIPSGHPRRLMEDILGKEGPRPGLLFGFGNIGGVGASMVRYWRKAGEPHGL